MTQQVMQQQHHSHHGNDIHAAVSTTNLADIEAKLRDAPDKYLYYIAEFLAGHINETKDIVAHFNGPILKASIKSIFWIFLLQYAILAMLGIGMNIAIIGCCLYHRFYRDATQAFIINLALCHFVQCAVVLPITLMVMMIQNWIFGQFLCFFLPMLQDIPLHVAMITHILIAWDRKRWLSDPVKCRFPAFVCCCATWLTGMIIALPYPIYTIYLEMGEFVPSLHGVGLCILNLMDDMHEYMRGLFFLMYCAPTVLLAYIYIRTSQALRPPDGPLSEYRAVVRMRQRNSSASSVERSYSNATTATVGGGAIAGAGGGADAGDGVCAGIGHHYTYSTGTATRSYDLYHAELDVYHEKRNQRNFGSMAAAQVICVCPLMILRFARLSIEENYENQKHFDFIYLMFVWIAFLPTIIFPFIYATQLLPRTQQQRICGYFRLFTKHFPKKSTKTLVDVNTASSRENSFEKDESTNISQGTCIVLNDDGFMGETVGDSSDRRALKKKLSETKLLKCQRRSDVKNVNNRSKKSLSRQSYEEVKNVNERIKSSFGSNVNNFSDALSHKREKLKTQLSQDSNEVKINIISDVISKSSAMQRHNKANTSGCSNGLAAKQRRLKTLDNCSSMSSSTYCNGNGSLVNNFDSNHFGDNENSSMVNGMVVQIGSEGGSIGLPPYHEGKMPCYAEVLKTPDLSSSDISYNLSRMNSSSNFENELDTIDLLELERNRIDMQELLEKQGKTIRERRRLPDIDKLCQRSPKFRSLAASTITLSANMSVFSDPLQTSSETLGTSSTLNGETSSVSSHVIPLDSDKFELYSRSTIINEHSLDEGISGDFHDDYKPGDAKHAVPDSALPASSPVQYQYTRRLSRKPSHHQQHISANMSSHRLSKRDSFHSIHNNDLIAGAFGEIDPTQPLTKMSIIDNRMLMRRSSGVGGVGGGSGGNSRASGFSSPNRSSTKSRDYNHGSTHSPQPELDFRENIFAEL